MSLGEMEHNIATVDQCAELCDNDYNCRSLEYSRKHSQCKLNHKENPTKQEPYPDFVFCQRGGDQMQIK